MILRKISNRKRVGVIKNQQFSFEVLKEEPEEHRAYREITPEEAKDMLLKGGVTVVDVRTEEEYVQKHIPGAVLVPLQSIGDRAPEALPDKDALLLIHCRAGVRSKKAAELLVKLGYTRVLEFGGIVDWKYETETGMPVIGKNR